MKDKILVHICCAPDAVYFLKKLREDYPEAEIVGYFYDPNIHPYEEYKLRYLETERTCRELGIKLIEGEYDIENWLNKVKGYEDEPERGKRCEICFDYRLERSVEVAQKLGCNYLTTTLLMSPKKSIPQLKKAGERAVNGKGIKFLAPDYRKGGGTQEMFKLSKEMDIYQQDYCGCIYGLFKQKSLPIQWDLVSVKGRAPGSKEEKIFFKEVRLLAESLGFFVKEYEFPFLNWKLLEGKLEVNKEIVPSFILPYSQSIRGVAKGNIDRQIGNKLFLNKQGVKIILAKEFKAQPLERITGLSNPTFIVPEEYKEKLLNGKIVATLKTEFLPEKSEVMFIGSLDGERYLGIPADTLQDLKGITLEQLKEILKSKEKEIKEGKLTIVLLGAESYGRVGSNFVREYFGRNIDEFFDWQEL